VVPKTVAWDGVTQGPWSREIDGADVVINLAGRSVDCRYTEENRREILESRVESAKAIGTAISKAIVPPLIWMQMSTATIYAHRYDAPNDERKGIIGDAAPWDFSIEVAKAWESAVDAFALPRTRVIKLRTAMVMTAAHGSPFDALLNLVRAGVGGRAGDGLQFVSWIHHRDFVRSVLWLIAHPEFHGVVNLAAPNPLPNATFMRTLRDAWGARVGLPIPVWLLEAGARVIGTEPELILKSRRVVPRRLNESGFAFSFPHWQEAARDLCEDYRAMQHKAPDVRGVTTTAPPAIEQTIGASRY
jgi:uncharacterized protein (TIGR01777 family)